MPAGVNKKDLINYIFSILDENNTNYKSNIFDEDICFNYVDFDRRGEKMLLNHIQDLFDKLFVKQIGPHINRNEFIKIFSNQDIDEKKLSHIFSSINGDKAFMCIQFVEWITNNFTEDQIQVIFNYVFPEPIPESLPELISEPEPETIPEPLPEPIPEPLPELISEPKPEPIPEIVPEPISEPETKPESYINNNYSLCGCLWFWSCINFLKSLFRRCC